MYLGSFDNRICSLDGETGEEFCTFEMGGIVRSSPTVVDETVFIGSHCRSAECAIYYDETFPRVGYVYALDRETGELDWEYETGNEILSSPAVDSDIVYIGSSDSKVRALERSTGEKIWEYETDGSIYSSPAVSERIVYIGSNGRKVHALDSTTGENKWTFNPNVNVLTGSPVIGDAVYIGGGAIPDTETGERYSKLYALSKERGAEIWSHRVSGEIIGGSPAIANGIIYIGSNNVSEAEQPNPGIFALTESGEEYWSYRVGESEYFHGEGGFGSSPAIVDDALYIGSADNHVYSFS